ncbi:uncharacterized protein BDW43DRAFT_289561 [Aspergillus alliaceus]|uniref:uncharacterized protein n=1 Tax=Petromyces alliaceus TaxID=209559 RepID=UPI0012A5FCDF|nr:uncharacterized protein BDW43DRAFT_289561 [Aspergillus alliaceus]KAB8229003.1 hypothetical protein BDW43DRAFT_289561 [Aspergillus alliaceus]
MEAIGSASAILAIATAGIQCTVKLVSFAGQVKTAPERITHIAEDVSQNASILQQLGDLMSEDLDAESIDGSGDGAQVTLAYKQSDEKAKQERQSVFSEAGLETTTKVASRCHEIFQSLNKLLEEAGRMDSRSGKLRSVQKLKWPFLKPEIDTMREELKEAKGTLMLMLQLASLAMSRKMMDRYSPKLGLLPHSEVERQLLINSIVAQKGSEDHQASNKQPLHRCISCATMSIDGEEQAGPEVNFVTANLSPRGRSISGSPVSPPSPTHEHRWARNCNVCDYIPLMSQAPINTNPPLSLYIIRPHPSLMDRKVHINCTYHQVALSEEEISSRLNDWRSSSSTTVLDQVLSLTAQELDTLNSLTERCWDGIDRKVSWIHFGEYLPVIDGFDEVKARTLTVIITQHPPKFEPTSRNAESGFRWGTGRPPLARDSSPRMRPYDAPYDAGSSNSMLGMGLPHDQQGATFQSGKTGGVVVQGTIEGPVDDVDEVDGEETEKIVQDLLAKYTNV